MQNRGIMDARSLACYIKERCNNEISPIKLQKSLYFCFAYWGGFVKKQSLGKSEIKIELSEILFDNSIEAWVYGPVVPDVYHEKDLDSCKKDNSDLFPNNFIKEYIDGILDDILASSDFALVNASHQDKCWIRHFKPKSIFHNDKIPSEEIIKEYVKIT